MHEMVSTQQVLTDGRAPVGDAFAHCASITTTEWIDNGTSAHRRRTLQKGYIPRPNLTFNP
eukprot:1379194-Pleurochrysis_carterae.AAC.1